MERLGEILAFFFFYLRKYLICGMEFKIYDRVRTALGTGVIMAYSRDSDLYDVELDAKMDESGELLVTEDGNYTLLDGSETTHIRQTFSGKFLEYD